MAKVLSPIFANKEEIFVSPRNRFFTVFKPIQSSDYFGKHSDFFAYLLNPVIDICLAPVFVFDVLIDVVNMVASLAKAIYIWSHNQQSTSSLLDRHAKDEFKEAGKNFLHAISALMSAIINPLLSILSLITRPVMSGIKLIADAVDECSSSSHRI